DGRLDEEGWSAALRRETFYDGYTNALAGLFTEVRISYDAKYLYMRVTGERSVDLDEAIPERLDLVIRPDLQSNRYYVVPLIIRSGDPQINPFYGTGSRVILSNVKSIVANHNLSWTAEVAVPISDLNLTALVAGQELQINVV